MELHWHRRAHPRRAVARATAILAAHAPLLTQFAALAVQAVSAQLERAAASALQRSLVPSALPAAGGLEIAARYVPGTGIWEAASMTCSASRRAR
jgi:serine phosphatase RsbU (regulator of sigma subunit)